MNKLSGYNIRVYGILQNSEGEILLSKESAYGKNFVKFPGGGHELGEGIADTVIREFREELGIAVDIVSHFYTTDFFQVSVFDNKEQLISIYYRVSSNEAATIKNKMNALDCENRKEHYFFWRKNEELKVEDVTYPVDRKVVKLLIDRAQTKEK